MNKFITSLLNSNNYDILFVKNKRGLYIDQINCVDEDLQIRLVKNVPNFIIREGNYCGEHTVYPENILLECIESKDSEEWISNYSIIEKNAVHFNFILEVLNKYPAEFIKHKAILNKVDHRILSTKEFKDVVEKYGSEFLFDTDKYGDTFLFNKYLDVESINSLNSILGEEVFNKLMMTKSTGARYLVPDLAFVEHVQGHFLFSRRQNRDVLKAIFDNLTNKNKVLLVTAEGFNGTDNGRVMKDWK